MCMAKNKKLLRKKKNEDNFIDSLNLRTLRHIKKISKILFLQLLFFHPLEEGWRKISNDAIDACSSHRYKHFSKDSF